MKFCGFYMNLYFWHWTWQLKGFYNSYYFFITNCIQLVATEIYHRVLTTYII